MYVVEKFSEKGSDLQQQTCFDALLLEEIEAEAAKQAAKLSQ